VHGQSISFRCRLCRECSAFSMFTSEGAWHGLPFTHRTVSTPICSPSLRAGHEDTLYVVFSWFYSMEPGEDNVLQLVR
jgi:hypothetical protein